MAKQERVTVVTMGEYARKWAHDLDSARREWQERRPLNRELPSSARTDYTKPSSVDQAKTWEREATSALEAVDLWLREFNHEKKIYKESKTGRFLRLEKLKEKNFWLTVKRILNEYIRIETAKAHETSSAERRFNSRRALAKAMNLLGKLKEHATFTEEEQLMYLQLVVYFQETRITPGNEIDDESSESPS